LFFSKGETMNNPEKSYLAGVEANRQFAKRQLELSNDQATQGAEIAGLRRDVEGLKQQVDDLNGVVTSLTKPVRRRWWFFIF
jgi:cell division protein FtsB